jgi:SAM-dependent methyltransferase
MPVPTFPDHFSASAAAYAAFRPDYPPALFEWVAGLARGRACAWDCATGSGQAALALAEHFDRVVATDASREQVAHARPHPRVRYAVAAAEACGLPDDSVDAVCVAQALHWFRLPAFYAEVRRVLRPDGVLAAWCYERFRTDDPAVDGPLQHFYDETVGPFWPPQRDLLAAGYRTLAFPFDEVAPPPFELTAAWTLERLLGYLRTWSATARYREARGHDAVALLQPRLAAAWGDPAVARTFRWPLSVRAGRVSVAGR